jgi:MFS family permease
MKIQNHTNLQLISLFLIIFIDTFCWFIIAPVLLRLYIAGPATILPTFTPMAERYFLYGLTMSLPPLAFILTSPFIGFSSDKFGRKKVLFLCLITALIGFLLPIYGILKKTISIILVGRFIGGASTASQPIAQAAVADLATTTKEKSRFFSVIALAMTLGLLLGPLVGGYLSDSSLVSWFNVKVPFYIGAVLTILNLLLVAYYYRPTRKKIETEPLAFNIADLLKILINKEFVIILAAFFLLEFSWSQYYQSVFLIFAKLFKYSPNTISLFTAFAGVCMCIGLSVIPVIAVRYITVQKLALISMCGMLIGMIGCNVMSIPMQWIFVTLVAVFTGLAYIALITLLSEKAGKHHQGLVLGIAGSTLALAWLITGFLSGILASVMITLPLLIALAAIFLGTGLTVFYNL